MNTSERGIENIDFAQEWVTGKALPDKVTSVWALKNE